MCSGRSDWALPQPGFPIRRSTDQSLVDSSPWLFAATHVLHRHLAPRHPPLALCSLKSHSPRPSTDRNTRRTSRTTTCLQDARARYAVLKDAAETTCVSRRRYDGSGAELDGGVTRSAVRVSGNEPTARSGRLEAVSSKQSSEN